MSGRAVLAIDQGTTGSRALLLDAAGRTLASAYREFPQHFPRAGWVEHDPEEIWASVRESVGEALRASGLAPAAVAAIGITNQRETTVVWERAGGSPAAPAIVWQDRRTTERCAELRASRAEEKLRRRTGLVADPYFSATKLEWLLERNPGWRARAADGELLFGTVDSWLIWQLTGGTVHATDPTNASRTLLYALGEGWDPELCELFGVPPVMLPAVRPSAGLFGYTSGDVFGAEVPVAGVAGDQQAALYGQGAWRAGEAKNTYGTGAFVLLHAGERRPADVGGVLITAACGPRGEPALAYEGAILVAGAAVQWLRDGLRLVRESAETEATAGAVHDTEGVFFVPAFAGLGTPHWEPRARGTLVGITRGTRREHIVRAALEAMAYSTREALEVMAAGGPGLLALRADGGAARNDWLMQFQADVLGVPVHRPEAVELTAVGAAGLAGVATGFWPEPEAFLPARGPDRVFEPRPGAREAAEEGYAGWRRAVRAVLAWAADRP